MNTSVWAPTVERVLCALDVQQPTLGALKLASLIAGRFGASLEALYVGSNATSAGFGGLLTRAGRVDELMSSHNAEQQLEELVRGVTGGVSATTRFVLGSPASAILERAGESPIDLIVLGARQRSDLGWQFRDDVARDVAALASCATLTVHDRDAPVSIERILAPIDFTSTNSSLLWAAAIGLRFGAKVQLLHVVSPQRSTTRSVDSTRKVVRSSSIPPEVAGKLALLEQSLVRLGVTVASELTIASNVANGIADYNDRGEFDLVVVGMHGDAERPARLTRGTVSTLRNRMSVPVLSVRAAPLDSARAASGD